MLLVQLLSHVGHDLQVLVERLLANQWILIVLHLLKRVCSQLLLMSSEGRIKLLPHLVPLYLQPGRGSILEDMDLIFEVIHHLPGLLNILLLDPSSAIQILLVRIVTSFLRFGIWVILSESQIDIIHLILILTFVCFSL